MDKLRKIIVCVSASLCLGFGVFANTFSLYATDDYSLIRSLYEYILEIKHGEWSIEDYISSDLAKRIWTEDYDGCYQIWVFRTGYQDGYDEPSKILSITPAQNGWYEVKYSDMGILGKTLVHVANGRIDDYVAFDKAFQY